MIGAGTYASHLVAVSTTGNGEEFMRRCSAHAVHMRLHLVPGMSLQRAVTETLSELGPDQGGLVAVDREGHVCALMNTSGMYRAFAVGGEGVGHVGIWDEIRDVPLV